MRRKDLTEPYEPKPDPLANVEKLLDDLVAYVELAWDDEMQVANVREAVRRLIDVANTDPRTARYDDALDALLAFDRSLDGPAPEVPAKPRRVEDMPEVVGRDEIKLFLESIDEVES